MKINFDVDSFKQTILPVYRDDLEDYNNRIVVLYGGAGSGKSVYATQKIVYKLLKEKRKCLIVRKTDNSIRASIYQEIVNRLDEMKLTKYCTINKKDFTIELPNGSIFLARGLQDPERIKSISGIDDILIEEATELNKEDFQQLNLRLRSKKKHQQIHLMFNPVSKQNWVFKYFQFDKGTTPKNTKIIKTSYKDNIFLDDNYIAEMEKMKETNYSWYKIYAEGEFCTLDKRVFTNWEVLDFNINKVLNTKIKQTGANTDNLRFIKDNPIYKKALKKLTFRFGLDTGWNDPTAFIAMLVDEENKEIYIYDEMYQRFMTNDDIIRNLKYKGYFKEQIICDSAEPRTIDYLRTHGASRVKGAIKGKGSILEGIRRLQQFKIYIHPRCENMITEAENYTWKKDKQGEYTDTPLDDGYCHLWDACRYATEYLKGNVVPFDRRKFGI